MFYVDDASLIGDKKAIDFAKRELATKFAIKEIGERKEYVGVTIKRNGNTATLSQPDIVDRIVKYFEEDANKLKNFETPMAHNHNVVRPSEDTVRVGEQEQSKFRSGVGSLLYLVKHSRADLPNAVRELSKVMDSAAEAHMKDLY
jgi:hypothetical protein